MSDHEPWLGDVTAALERRIAAHDASPDFLDVVTRAHRLDPEAVPAESIEHADALVAALEDDLEFGSPQQEAQLDQWLGDVKAAIDRRADAQQSQGRPPLPVERDRRAWWWLGGLAVAAAVVLVLGLSSIVDVLDQSEPDSSHQSPNSAEASDTEGTARHLTPAPPPPTPSPSPRPTPPQHEAVVIPEAAPPLPPPPTAETPAPRASRARRPSKDDRLEALAQQAQRHWKAGRHAEAEDLFEQIVAEGGRRLAAQMAYADLFTLANQAGNVEAQRKRWKAYLRRFPGGRFADDARAGLCRSAARPERTACWSEYLADFPQGSFRAEANRATEGTR